MRYLYGTAATGGLNEGGLLYRIRHNGSGYQIIHYFSNEVFGMNPYSGLTEANGVLFGTTFRGGAVEQTGTIYKIEPDGTGYLKLHDFDGVNGRNPSGEVIIVNNVVYGMTTKGGNADRGIIYRINTDGSGFRKLHDFSGPDGTIPSGALVHDLNGNLFWNDQRRRTVQ